VGAESGTGTTPETREGLPDRVNCLTPNECFDGRMTLLYFIFTVTFSAQLHKAHSKVRVSTPSGPRYQTSKRHWTVAFRAWRPFNFNEIGIGDERLWHGVARLRSGESTTLSVTVSGPKRR
jgi:hypothetical protein